MFILRVAMQEMINRCWIHCWCKENHKIWVLLCALMLCKWKVMLCFHHPYIGRDYASKLRCLMCQDALQVFSMRRYTKNEYDMCACMCIYKCICSYVPINELIDGSYASNVLCHLLAMKWIILCKVVHQFLLTCCDRKNSTFIL